MLKWFKCPDGQLTTVEDCIKGCRLEARCFTVPMLLEMSAERVWSGTPSTTQLLNGTMQEFLTLTKDYAVDPQHRVFAVLGTKIHASLEERAREMNLPAEIALSVDRDIFDLLEPNDTGWTLTDNKTWGSYRVVRAIGIVSVGKKPDPSGAIYKSSGAWGKAGSPKMVNVFQVDPSKADMWEVEYQLNRYRVMLAERGIEVNKLQCQIVVRDGGLAVARDRGVDRNGYLIPVKYVAGDLIIDYFQKKYKDLMSALERGQWSEVCSPRECWDDNKCKEYCDVAHYCPKGLLFKTGERQ